MPGELFQNSSQKHLTFEERIRFLEATERNPHTVLTSCAVFAYAGCRVPEALTPTDCGAGRGCSPGSERRLGDMSARRVMNGAGLNANSKGLRHGVGVAALQSGIPLNLVQRWLGHAQLSTTAIYAIEPEEQAISARMWATS